MNSGDLCAVSEGMDLIGSVVIDVR